MAGEEIASGLLLYQGRNENFFLLMAEPPRVVEPDEVPSREYIFVLDVSGSMNGFPLDTAKKLMSDLANVLRPSDTFNIVVFADGSETFSPRVCAGDASQSHACAPVHRAEEGRWRDAAAGCASNGR